MAEEHKPTSVDEITEHKEFSEAVSAIDDEVEDILPDSTAVDQTAELLKEVDISQIGKEKEFLNVDDKNDVDRLPNFAKSTSLLPSLANISDDDDLKPGKSDLFSTDTKQNDIIISVSNPHKIGDGMNAFMSYKVQTKTSMPSFKRPELVVDRRFSDFLGLHDKLVAKYRHTGTIVPPAPEKSIVGMTLIKMSKSDEEAASINFVEKRRAALERFLNRVACHPCLVLDQDFRDFLEQDELPLATNTRALSGAGVMRLVKNVEGALNKITMKMTEEDNWFEEKQQQVENLEQQLRRLHNALEGLVQNRKDLSASSALFAKSAATLGNAEEHTALSRALAQLSDAFEKMECIQQDQSNTDYYGFSETLSDYIRIISEIKEVFLVRVKCWQNWQNAVQNVAKKKEAQAKVQASGRVDKLSQIQADIKEMETRVETSKSDFNKLSAAIKKDIQRFERNRVMDFRESVLVFLKNVMKSQEQSIRVWEAFLPEARAIA